MNPLEDALNDIRAAEVALRDGYRQLGVDFLRDALDKLVTPNMITVVPDVALCERLERLCRRQAE